MKEPILPCPFCGSEAKHVHEMTRTRIVDNRHIHSIKIYCDNRACGASMKTECLAPYGTIPESLLAWMINKWNTRSS